VLFVEGSRALGRSLRHGQRRLAPWRGRALHAPVHCHAHGGRQRSDGCPRCAGSGRGAGDDRLHPAPGPRVKPGV